MSAEPQQYDGDLIVARMERMPFSRFHLRVGSVLAVVFTTLNIGFVATGTLSPTVWDSRTSYSAATSWLPSGSS